MPVEVKVSVDNTETPVVNVVNSDVTETKVEEPSTPQDSSPVEGPGESSSEESETVVPEDVTEGTISGSMGGHDPDARKGNMENLVRSFGKWAKGRQSVCVRVLTTRHPELCTKYKGGCDRLCAWLKDQFRGSTKWRNEEGDFIAFLPATETEAEIVFDVMLSTDLLAEASEGKTSVERPEWATDEVLAELQDVIEKDTPKSGDTKPAKEAQDTVVEAMSYDEIQSALARAVRQRYEKVATDRMMESVYAYVERVYPDRVIFNVDSKTFSQEYAISKGEATLLDEPVRVRMEYVAAESGAPEVIVPEKATTESEDLPFYYATTEYNGVKVAVKVEEGKIIGGPKVLVGQAFPTVVKDSDKGGVSSGVGATEGTASSAGGTLGAVAESEFVELSYDGGSAVIKSLDVVEEAGSKKEKRPTTPSGKAVDAIVRIISPGPGNMRDRYYYPAEAIEGTISVFNGMKMYKDHLAPEEYKKGRPRNVDDWVATIKEVWGTTEGGFAGVNFVDEQFKRKVQLGAEDMGASVRGLVKANPGVIEGERYNVVEAFTQGFSVDFVTEAGARGGIVSIAESKEGVSTKMAEIQDTMGLDEAMEARPDLFEAHAERLSKLETSSTESKTEESTQTTEGTTEVITMDKVQEMLEAAVKSVEAKKDLEISESFKARDKRTNSHTLETALADSGLPKTTRDRIHRELKDVYFEDSVQESDEGGQTEIFGVDRYREAVQNAIRDAHRELAEASGGTRIIGTGPTGETVESFVQTTAPSSTYGHEYFMKRLVGESNTSTPAAAGETKEDK